jgi:putative FmdB family regulatory protein
MPIYGFHCTGCEKEFETLVRASDEVTCPSCGSAHLEQLLSRIAKPSAGAEDAGASSGGHACASPSCCMGGGCG